MTLPLKTVHTAYHDVSNDSYGKHVEKTLLLLLSLMIMALAMMTMPGNGDERVHFAAVSGNWYLLGVPFLIKTRRMLDGMDTGKKK